MNTNTLRTLEFESIRKLLCGQAGSASGRALLEGRVPLGEPSQVREALALTTEACLVLRTLGRQSYHTLPDVSDSLPLLQIEGSSLEPQALLNVASFIEGATEIARSVAKAPGASRLACRASEVPDLGVLPARIRRAILLSGEVADEASPKLLETRRALLRLRSQLDATMESFLRGRDADRILQDKVITIRNERYVLLLKAEHRGQLPGVIHGSSGSGASLFVEPLPAVELNNDIVSMREEERRELQRILRDLTACVAERASELALAVAILAELDARQAMALLARDMDAVEPEVTEACLDLKDARHPLLMSTLTERLGIGQRSAKGPVPVSIGFTGDETALLVSGPNTGGKTVALKTAGLLALMAQTGLHVPAAAGSRLPVFRRIYADIGDEQSIAESLSTFSAHLAHIVDMTADLPLPALVLLDEVGAGTDPTEGGALGVAIVDHFRSRGAHVIATTHHGVLKAYAQSTPGVGCASFGYDPQTYEPTYRLVMGTAGRSLALEMAERLGLPSAVVEDARSRLGSKEVQVEVLLRKLEEEQVALEKEKADLLVEKAAHEEALARLKEAEGEIKARKERELERFALDLRRRSEDLARMASEAIAQAVQTVERSSAPAPAGAKARRAVRETIRKAHDELMSDPALGVAQAARSSSELAPGMRVRIQELGVVGEVLSIAGSEHGGVEVAVAGKRLRVPRSELIALSGASAPAQSPPATSPVPGRKPAAAEVNLVGLTVDEALPRVDKLLDEAFLAEHRRVRVIHGFGTGRLRQAVASLLEAHPHVAAFHLGAEGHGGVTVVELKD